MIGSSFLSFRKLLQIESCAPNIGGEQEVLLTKMRITGLSWVCSLIAEACVSMRITGLSWVLKHVFQLKDIAHSNSRNMGMFSVINLLVVFYGMLIVYLGCDGDLPRLAASGV